MRSTALKLRMLALTLLTVFAGCDKPAAPVAAKQDTPEPASKLDPDADPGADDNEANFAQPTAEPPRAPEGAITLRDPWLYVQTCAEPNPCPDLLQPAGDAHCRELQLGGHVNWRLPSKAEALRFKSSNEGLEATAGYHWTRTPYEEDMAQVYIVDGEDPQGAPATTIPRDRKPFRIRCVKEP